MTEGGELDRTHAFWLGALFVSPRLRHVAARSGRGERLPRAAMRLLVLLVRDRKNALLQPLGEDCGLDDRELARALRRLERLAGGIGRTSFRLDIVGTRVRLVELAAASAPPSPRDQPIVPARIALALG